MLTCWRREHSAQYPIGLGCEAVATNATLRNIILRRDSLNTLDDIKCLPGIMERYALSLHGLLLRYKNAVMDRVALAPSQSENVIHD